MPSAVAAVVRQAKSHRRSWTATTRGLRRWLMVAACEEQGRVSRRGHEAAITEVLVSCCRPMHLSPSDAERWIRSEVSALFSDSALAQMQITTLVSVPTWGRTWDHLIAIELRDGARASAAVTTGGCADLLGELRQLGMQPNVVVATGERTVVLTDPRP